MALFFAFSDLENGTRKRLAITKWTAETSTNDLLVSIRFATHYPPSALLFADKVCEREQNSSALIGCSLFASASCARLFFSTAQGLGDMPETARLLTSGSDTATILHTLYDEYKPIGEHLSSAQYQRQAAVGLLVKLLAMRRGGLVQKLRKLIIRVQPLACFTTVHWAGDTG